MAPFRVSATLRDRTSRAPNPTGPLPLGGGEGERDPRAAARAVFGPDPAALGLDKSASDREPEARTAGRAGRVGPPEAVEHSPERFGGDSFAGVLDADAHLIDGRFDQDGDRAVGGRMAKGVD